MIKSFYCRETEKLFNKERSRKFPTEIERSAQRKLLIISAATDINDLRVPPGNKLEKLSKDRAGQYSIRINDQ
jgi:proteic killer suppression protein